jgi:cytochrome c553
MRINEVGAETRRLLLADWPHDLLLLAGMIVLSLAAFTVRADVPDASVRIYAQRLAVTVCTNCHGARGNSTQPKFPRLAGQNPRYLAAQLKAFRSQTRGDPDAVSFMWGMAGQLDDATIDALAEYYSLQQPESSAQGPSAQAVRGREIFEHGVPSEGVPACNSCHGPDAHGTQDFPRLAGQHAQYILKQLVSFQSNMRDVAIMHGVAQNLRAAEIESLAAYLNARP